MSACGLGNRSQEAKNSGARGRRPGAESGDGGRKSEVRCQISRDRSQEIENQVAEAARPTSATQNQKHFPPRPSRTSCKFPRQYIQRLRKGVRCPGTESEVRRLADISQPWPLDDVGSGSGSALTSMTFFELEVSENSRGNSQCAEGRHASHGIVEVMRRELSGIRTGDCTEDDDEA